MFGRFFRRRTPDNPQFHPLEFELVATGIVVEIPASDEERELEARAAEKLREIYKVCLEVREERSNQ